MTAILAARTKYRGRQCVIMGADRALSGGDGSINTMSSPKIVRAGEFLIGMSGAVGGDFDALANVDPEHPMQILEALGSGSSYAGDVLIAARTYIWCACWIPEDRWSLNPVLGPVQTGNGGAWLHGAWDALPSKMPPTKRMTKALEIAAKNCTGVAAPFDIMYTS